MCWLLAVSDKSGCYAEVPDWEAAFRSGGSIRRAYREELIPLPPGSVVHYMPGLRPLGWDKRGRLRPYRGGWSLAVQLPSGYTRTLLPAWKRTQGALIQPFFGYTAAAFKGDTLYVAACCTEKNHRWQPDNYGGSELHQAIEEVEQLFPDNRMVQQLKRCALEYGCYNASNVFFRRWEGAAVVSPGCNARCVGCISLQPSDLPPSPQQRIRFKTRLDEVVEIGVYHLSHGYDTIYSFGQGCEGEPLLRAELIAEAIRRIRNVTCLGTIHLNTNGSLPANLQKLVKAGLDSVRVSLNSAVKDTYTRYYRPRGYKFEDVLHSIDLAKREGLFVSINLLTMPGWNDTRREMEALLELLSRYKVDMLQIRNLNIDPDLYAEVVPPPRDKAIGILDWISSLRRELPGLKIGNHTPPVRSLSSP